MTAQWAMPLADVHETVREAWLAARREIRLAGRLKDDALLECGMTRAAQCQCIMKDVARRFAELRGVEALEAVQARGLLKIREARQ